MKRFYKALLLGGLVFLSAIMGTEVSAQCSNLTLTLARTNSTCFANGTIKVTVSGGDLGNIRQSDMQFGITGSQTVAFSQYANNTIENLPAGTYTITLRAFCIATNGWVTTTSSATTTITSSYNAMIPVVGTIRPTLFCITTGMIPITIQSGTGSAPFTVEMTQKPAGYTGQTVFTSTNRNFELDGLNAGEYKLKIYDACGYTVERTVVVGALNSNSIPAIFQGTYRSVMNPTPVGNCNTVNVDRAVSYNTNERFYYVDNSEDYFEVAFLVNDTGTKNWQPLIQQGSTIITLPSPYTVATMRDNNYTITPYIRVKGGGAGCEFKLPNITQRTISSSITQTPVGCEALNVSGFNPELRVICYPYRWRILRSNGTVFLDWQGPFLNNVASNNAADNVPFGSRIEIMDNEGFVQTQHLLTAPPVPSVMGAPSSRYEDLNADGFYSSYMVVGYQGNTPIGTRIQFLSGPTVPVHTDYTTTTSQQFHYPFSSNVESQQHVSMKPGVYKFGLSLPGNCVMVEREYDHMVYKLATPMSYTTNETCNELEITPTAGKLEMHNSGGVISTSDNLYYRIFSAIPSSLPYSTSYIQKGGVIKLTQPGTYVIGMYEYSGGGTPSQIDTIVYAGPTPLTLDDVVTSAYVCQGESTGFIRVRGKGGSGSYSYELYDNDVLKGTSTTGVFNYGTAGSTYTVRVRDVVCNTSYPQNITMLDLNNMSIVSSSNPAGMFCALDSIYIRCVSLGITTYTWTGPGINATNKNQQNLAFAAADLGFGTHNFTVSVAPENCGNEMQQTLTITIGNCAGAVDDYTTVIVNTKDTIDILDNDQYPSDCAFSVNPVITMVPKHGTYTIVDKKIIYTPNPNFTGADSMKYSVTCGENTTATVYINVIQVSATESMITANGATVCSGDQVSITASLTTPGSITSPVFKWYATQTGGTALYTGATFTPSPNLTATTTYYVSVSGTSHTESPRKAVTIAVTPRATPAMIKITQ